MYQTAFNSESADPRELQTLVDWLQKKTGATVNVESVILVSTDNVEISNMLDAMRNALKNGNGKKSAAPTNGKAAKKNKGAGAEPLGSRSRRIESTGEVMSLVELKKRIAEGAVPDQTIVTNVKNERWVVMGGELIQEPKAA